MNLKVFFFFIYLFIYLLLWEFTHANSGHLKLESITIFMHKMYSIFLKKRINLHYQTDATQLIT